MTRAKFCSCAVVIQKCSSNCLTRNLRLLMPLSLKIIEKRGSINCMRLRTQLNWMAALNGCQTSQYWRQLGRHWTGASQLNGMVYIPPKSGGEINIRLLFSSFENMFMGPNDIWQLPKLFSSWCLMTYDWTIGHNSTVMCEMPLKSTNEEHLKAHEECSDQKHGETTPFVDVDNRRN